MNILVLFPWKLYSRKVSPVRRHSIEAISKHHEVELLITGVGWKGYEEGKTVKENFHPDFTPDVVLVYKPEGNERANIPPLLGLRDCGVPVAMRYNECWWPDGLAAKEIAEAGASFVVLHHENDHKRVADKVSSDVRFAYLPHCASVSTFYSENANRPADVLLTGAVGEEHYPLRVKWAEVIEILKSRGHAAKQLLHPGYRAANIHECERIVADYAGELSRAKIALVCSSKWRYPLAKYVEAAMAGCHVIGDRPLMEPAGWDQLYTPVLASASPKHLANSVEGYLTGLQAESRALANLGRTAARQMFTQEVYAAQFTIQLRRFLDER